MKKNEFIKIVKSIKEKYWHAQEVDLDDNEVKEVERITTYNFKYWTKNEVYYYIKGLAECFEMAEDEWSYFEDEEDRMD